MIDTHALIWAIEGNKRLSAWARDELLALDGGVYVSAVTAWEFADLRARKRLPAIATFDATCRALRLEVLDLPSSLWALADDLPNIHGDPVDRMLIAHAIHADLPLVTADATIRSYPVRTIW